MTQTTPSGGPLDEQLAIRLQHQRIIVLGQEVDDPIANRVCAQLLLLSAEDPHRDISLYINSPGGSVTAGMAIYDVMRLIPNDVSTLGMGLAASMGQFLLTAGAPGKRFVLPSAEVLLGGHHERIQRHRREQSLALTARLRPELIAQARAQGRLGPDDERFLRGLG